MCSNLPILSQGRLSLCLLLVLKQSSSALDTLLRMPAFTASPPSKKSCSSTEVASTFLG